MIQKETLPNGVRIITEEMPQVRSVSIGLWVRVGSRFEEESLAGVSHFIEHMMFKGTKNRTARQIAEALDSVGGQINAFTAKEYTCYYARVLDNHLDVAVDVLSDMFFNSLFQPTEIEKEKNVILEEIKMYEDTPDDLVHDVFIAGLWPGHPLGRPIIGHRETVASLRPEKLVEFYRRHYTPDSLVVAVAGNIDHRRVVERLTPVFGSFDGRSAPVSFTRPQPAYTTVSRYKDTEQVHVVLGTEALPMNHPDIYALSIINTVLGGGVSSRLFQRVRENLGLVYSIYSYLSSYIDSGIFSLYAGLSPANLDRLLGILAEELERLYRQGLSEEELHRGREQLKGNLFLGLEGPGSRMTRIGKAEVCLGQVMTMEEIAAAIDAVTMDDIRRLCRQFFAPDHFTLAWIGPVKKEIKWENYC